MATPYLGSKISLISKSEIRYEGVLYTIDTRESTIALAQVRSFGTENRPAETYVAPREEIFEYIIFRANDIKDLIVDDPPPASITQALGDPAIIQAQSSMPTSNTTYTKPTLSTGAPSSTLNGPSSQITVGSTSAIAPPTSRPVGNLANMSVFTNANAGSQSSVTSGPPAAGPAFGVATTSSMGFRSGGSSPTGGHRRSPVSESGAPKSQGNRDDKAPKNLLPNNRDPRNQNFRDNYRVGGMGGDRRQLPPQYGRRPMPGQELLPTVRNMNFRGRGRQGPPPPPLPQMMGPPKRGPMMGRAPPQPRPQYNRGPINRNVRPTTSLKIEDDFDFEKANKEFEELESKLSKVKIEEGVEKKETGETGSTPQPQSQPLVSDDKPQKEGEDKDEYECVFYDKNKSFFDKISCEALERSKGRTTRIDWRQERKMNAETFGLNANNFRRGGGQRRQMPPNGPNIRNNRIFKGNYIDFNQRLRGRSSYGSNSNDRRVNQPQPSW